MKHRGTSQRHSLSNCLPSRWAKIGMLVALLSSCATNTGPVIMPLPEISADSAATLSMRSKDNFSDVQHHHQLKIDGTLVALFKAEDVRSFQLAEGTHTIELTCHSHYARGGAGFPINYNVADGQTKLDLNLAAGDQVCYKISFNPLNCAILQESGPSYCQ